jgi:hypothetical protein
MLAFIQSAYSQDRPSIAVYPVIVTSAAKSDVDRYKVDVQEVTRQIEEGIRATRRFKMFERSGEVMQSSVLREQDFAQGGRAMGDAAEFGKLNNVQMIIQPMITAFSLNSSHAPIEELPGKFRVSHNGRLSVTVKVLDTSSGEIKFQTTQESGFSQGGGVADSRVAGPGRDAWGGMAKESANKITNAVVGYVFPIQVIKADGSDIFVNRGEGGGIAAGESYDVYSVGEAMIDPVTNENLGSSEKYIGRVKVQRVAPRFSVVHGVGKLSATPKSGDILRKVTGK